MRQKIQWLGLVAGPAIAIVVFVSMPGEYTGTDGTVVELGHAARATAAAGVWMAIWWLSEAIPVYATALLPLVLFPLLGAAGIKQTAAPYGHELIYLFMGGFILALAMERWGLHRRIAFSALSLVGAQPTRIIAGFMGITAFMSMWVTNTATTIMMLPIAVSVCGLVATQIEKDQYDDSETVRNNFAIALLLGIAYSASIGGIGTIIGTAPNLLLVSYIEQQYSQDIGFATWMAMGVPLVLVFLPIVWLVLVKLLYPVPVTELRGGRALFRSSLHELGPMHRGEKIALVVFLATAVLWISRPWLQAAEIAGGHPLAGLSDTGIAVTAALSLFLLPVDLSKRTFVMDWETAVKLPWGLLILFGGGLSLAAAVDGNGVAAFLGSLTDGLQWMPEWLIVMSIIAMMLFLTELTSNTATTATLIPVLAALAPGLGLHPYVLIVPAAIAASCAFMLPVATPPNAIVFGSGLISIPQMSRAGLLLNLVGILLVTGLTYSIIIPRLLAP